MTKQKPKTPWQAAQWRHRNPTRVRKMVTAVMGKRRESTGAPGVTTLNREWFGDHGEQLTCCKGCGRHVCSCAPVAAGGVHEFSQRGPFAGAPAININLRTIQAPTAEDGRRVAAAMARNNGVSAGPRLICAEHHMWTTMAADVNCHKCAPVDLAPAHEPAGYLGIAEAERIAERYDGASLFDVPMPVANGKNALTGDAIDAVMKAMREMLKGETPMSLKPTWVAPASEPMPHWAVKFTSDQVESALKMQADMRPIVDRAMKSLMDYQREHGPCDLVIGDHETELRLEHKVCVMPQSTWQRIVSNARASGGSMADFARSLGKAEVLIDDTMAPGTHRFVSQAEAKRIKERLADKRVAEASSLHQSGSISQTHVGSQGRVSATLPVVSDDSQRTQERDS